MSNDTESSRERDENPPEVQVCEHCSIEWDGNQFLKCCPVCGGELNTRVYRRFLFHVEVLE